MPSKNYHEEVKNLLLEIETTLQASNLTQEKQKTIKTKLKKINASISILEKQYAEDEFDSTDDEDDEDDEKTSAMEHRPQIQILIREYKRDLYLLSARFYEKIGNTRKAQNFQQKANNEGRVIRKHISQAASDTLSSSKPAVKNDDETGYVKPSSYAILEDMLDKETWDTLQEIFSLSEITPTSYQQFETTKRHLLPLLEKTATKVDQLRPKNDPELGGVRQTERKLRICLFQFKRNFVNYVIQLQSDTNESTRELQYQVLFGCEPGYTIAKERIKQIYRKLALDFYPDKAPKDFPNDEILYETLFKIILENKEELMKLSERYVSMDKYKEEAQYWLEMAIDYQHIIKKRDHKLKHLNVSVRNQYNTKKLEQLQKEAGYKAYEQYRAACMYADKQNDKGASIQIRRLLALSLYMADDSLGAQLYAIGALSIFRKLHFTHFTLYQNEYNQIITLMGKIEKKAMGVAVSPRSTETEMRRSHREQRMDDAYQQAVILRSDVRTLVQRQHITDIQTFQDLRRLENAVKQDSKAIIKHINSFVLTPDRTKSKTDVHKEYIKHLRTQAGEHILTGAAVATGGAAYVISTLIFSSFFGFPGLLIAGASVYLGAQVVGKGIKIADRPVVMERFNEIVQTAMRCYDKEKYQQFLKVLSERFDFVLNDNIYYLIEQADERKLKIDADHIINMQLKFGFRVDGIAYLLCLIGQVLINKRVTFSTLSPDDLDSRAIDIFKTVVESVQLQEAAEKLDQKISHDAPGVRGSSFFTPIGKLGNYFLFGIPEEYYLDAQKALMVNRLEEMRNIARINLAILYLIKQDDKSIDLAKKYLFEAKKSMAKYYAFDTLAQNRVEILEDLMRAFGISVNEAAVLSISHSNIEVYEQANRIRNVKGVLINNKLYPYEVVQCAYSGDERQNLYDVIFTSIGDTFHTPTITRQILAENVRTLYTHAQADERRKIDKILVQAKVETIDEWVQQFTETHTILSEPVLQIMVRLYPQFKFRTFVMAEHPNFGGVLAHQKTLSAATSQRRKKQFVIDLCLSGEAGEITYVAHLKVSDDQYISSLLCALTMTTSATMRRHVHQKIADHYWDKANLFEKKYDKINALPLWQRAQKHYREACSGTGNIDSALLLRVAECQLMLCRYKAMVSFLTSNERVLKEHQYYHLLLAKAYKHCGQYAKAVFAVNHALDMVGDRREEVIHEKKILEKLLDKEHIHGYVRQLERVKVEENKGYYLSCHRVRDDYNIFSVDGGGIRGLLPALFASEIEARTHRPMSHLFQSMAGTSTGGILTAGLSVPYEIETAYYKPKYRALDIVKLYSTEGNKIFFPTENTWEDTWNWMIGHKGLTKPLYQAKGRKEQFIRYFGNSYLGDMMTELVIPAVDESNRTKTHIFSRAKARRSQDADYPLVDVLMATSAAPTYFAPHKIQDRLYLDGGVQMNDPAGKAYEQAVRLGMEKEQIFVLSLGTGDFIPDLLNPNASRGLLFWGRHLKDVTLSCHHGNVHTLMQTHLGDNYQRWQVWFDELIQMDAHSDSDIQRLFEYGRVFLEDMYASDDNRMNKLIERLDRDIPGSSTAAIGINPGNSAQQVFVEAEIDIDTSTVQDNDSADNLAGSSPQSSEGTQLFHSSQTMFGKKCGDLGKDVQRFEFTGSLLWQQGGDAVDDDATLKGEYAGKTLYFEHGLSNKDGACAYHVIGQDRGKTRECLSRELQQNNDSVLGYLKRAIINELQNPNSGFLGTYSARLRGKDESIKQRLIAQYATDRAVLQQYINEVTQPGVWMDANTMLALAAALNYEVIIWYPDSNNSKHVQTREDMQYTPEHPENTVHVYYVDGKHFDFLYESTSLTEEESMRSFHDREQASTQAMIARRGSAADSFPASSPPSDVAEVQHSMG